MFILDYDESPIDIEYWEDSCGYCDYESYYKVIDKKIKNDPSFALNYALKNGKLDEKYEKVFEKNPKEAYLYARYIYKGRLPKNLEKSFEYSAQWAYSYSIFLDKRLDVKIENAFVRDTIEERGEPTVSDFFYMHQYSLKIIKGNFSEKVHRSLFLRYSFDENCSKQYLKLYFKN